jgi:hypothetical protein
MLSLTLEQIEGFGKRDLQNLINERIEMAAQARDLSEKLFAEADMLLDRAAMTETHGEWAKTRKEMREGLQELMNRPTIARALLPPRPVGESDGT